MGDNKKLILKDCIFVLPEGFKGNYVNALMLLAIKTSEDWNSGKIIKEEDSSTNDCLGLISPDGRYIINCNIE